MEPRSAAAQVAEQLRTAILAGRLVMGERLPSENELAASFGVSRTTIREAMKSLSAVGLIETSRGALGGAVVALPRSSDLATSLGDAVAVWFQAGSLSLAEVDSAREIIERGCVRLAAANRTEEDLVRISAVLEKQKDLGGDVDVIFALDLEFHVLLCQAAHNKVLETAMTAIHLVRPKVNTLLVEALKHVPARAIPVQQHEGLFQAVRAGDPDQAEHVLVRHLEHIRRLERDALHGKPAAEISIRALESYRPLVHMVLRPNGEPSDTSLLE